MIPAAVSTFLKGYAMGAANVIPGVSGGTVAFITGIFERLVNALKSFDVQAVKLLTKRDIRGFWQHIDGSFLMPLGLGVVVSVASLAKLLGYLFEHHSTLIWALFFGLILASIYYVGRTVSRWTPSAYVALVAGLCVAVGIALLKPASENDAVFYLIACGIVGVCSMIIPGLSGSFVLILMGNYFLILGALSDLVSAATSLDFQAMWPPLTIFIPVILGCVIGLVAFSHFISWLFRRFRDVAIALLTGFVAGSLMIIWPWKDELFQRAEDGSFLLKSSGEKVVIGYDWHLPSLTEPTTWWALLLIVIGALAVILMETLAPPQSRE